MDEDKPTSPNPNVEFLRKVFDLFFDVSIQNLALRYALVESKAVSNDLIESYLNKIRESEAAKKARDSLSVIDAQYLEQLLQSFQGPVQ